MKASSSGVPGIALVNRCTIYMIIVRFPKNKTKKRVCRDEFAVLNVRGRLKEDAVE